MSFDLQQLIIPVVISFASGFGGGLWSTQQKINDLEMRQNLKMTELDKRVAIIETREIEFEHGANQREQAIKDLNNSIRQHELESQRRYLDERKGR